MKIRCKFVAVLSVLTLGGCASFSPGEMFKPEVKGDFSNKEVLSKNKKFDDLKGWWGQFKDDNLIYLIDQATKKSPTVSSALLNIKNYELSLGLNNASSLPTVGVGASYSRGVSNIGGDISNYGGSAVQASWEIDLFGKNKTERNILETKANSASAQWHDAQTLVAANTAKSYFNYKLCKEILSNLNEDYSSRIRQQEITNLNVNVGLESKSSEYLSQARIAQAKTGLMNKEIECASEIKGLVALTGIPESKVKELVNLNKNINLDFEIPAFVPGDLIEQRPDVYSAKKGLEATYQNLVLAKKSVFPSISISGDISSSYYSVGGISKNGTTWSVGPLRISMPIFDGGRIAAGEKFADAQIENQKIVFDSTLRQAIKEVEVSLLNLSKIKEKTVLIDSSVDNYKKLYSSTLSKYEVGLSNLYELEDAKISYLNAQNSKVLNKKETLVYWIDLYKAVGGGFKEHIGEQK